MSNANVYQTNVYPSWGGAPEHNPCNLKTPSKWNPYATLTIGMCDSHLSNAICILGLKLRGLGIEEAEIYKSKTGGLFGVQVAPNKYIVAKTNGLYKYVTGVIEL